MWSLGRLEVGQGFYQECRLDNCAATQRALNPPKSRRPAEIRDRVFTTTIFTAVSAAKVGDVRLLVNVRRVR